MRSRASVTQTHEINGNVTTMSGGGGDTVFLNVHNQFSDVQNPNERRRLALAEIDRAPFGWYHVRACVVAGIGFFTDSYDVRFNFNVRTTSLVEHY